MEYVFTVLQLAILAGLAYWGYIAIPNKFVKSRPNKVVRVENQQAKLAVRANKPVRLFMGIDLRVDGNDFTKPDMFDLLKRNEGEPQNGGDLSFIIAFLDGWLFKVTGFHLVAVQIPDLWNDEVKIVEYDLKRVTVLKDKEGEWVEVSKIGADGKTDKTDHFRHNIDVSDLLIDDVETTKKMNVIGPNNTVDEVAQRIVVSLLVSSFLRVKNPVKALYQTSRDYLPYFRDVTKAEFREVIQGMGFDQLLISNVKESVVAQAMPKIQEELDKIGLWIENYKVKDIIPQKEFRDALNKQGIAVVEGQARVTRAAYDLTEADLTMQKDKKLAEGKAAYGKLRLEGLAEGAKAIHGVLRNHELTRDVVVADRYSEGVEKARNGTIYVAAGGRGPMPVLDFTPPNSGSGEKKEEAGGGAK